MPLRLNLRLRWPLGKACSLLKKERCPWTSNLSVCYRNQSKQPVLLCYLRISSSWPIVWVTGNSSRRLPFLTTARFLIENKNNTCSVSWSMHSHSNRTSRFTASLGHNSSRISKIKLDKNNMFESHIFWLSLSFRMSGANVQILITNFEC